MEKVQENIREYEQLLASTILSDYNGNTENNLLNFLQSDPDFGDFSTDQIWSNAHKIVAIHYEESEDFYNAAREMINATVNSHSSELNRKALEFIKKCENKKDRIKNITFLFRTITDENADFYTEAMELYLSDRGVNEVEFRYHKLADIIGKELAEAGQISKIKYLDKFFEQTDNVARSQIYNF